MANTQKKSQAEMAASRSKAKSTKTVDKKGSANRPKQNTSPNTEIPVRLITSLVFVSLFVLFLVLFINPDGAITGEIDKFIRGMIGGVGFFVSIPVLLYLFIIHAFSGKRPIIMRSVSLAIFVVLCGCLSHFVLNPQGLSSGFGFLIDLYVGGESGNTAGVLCGGLATLLRFCFGPYLPWIMLIIGILVSFLGGLQITIPSIIRAIQNRPKADWEDQVVEDSRSLLLWL